MFVQLCRLKTLLSLRGHMVAVHSFVQVPIFTVKNKVFISVITIGNPSQSQTCTIAQLSFTIKLDGVGPVDNRPSTNLLHDFVLHYAKPAHCILAV